MMFRRLRALLRARPQGHVCPSAHLRLILRALCEYVDSPMPRGASDSACQVAVMEAHDRLRARAEAAESALRTLLGVHLGVEVPTEAEIEPDVVLIQLLRLRGAGSVQG